jgi:hypothetical protein
VIVAAAGEGIAVPDSIVTLSCNVWLPSLEPSRRLRLAKDAAMRAFSVGARVGGGPFPARRLRAGPVDESGRYVADLVGFWTNDAWRVGGGTDWLATAASIRVPVLSVLARGDRLAAHRDGARRWAARIGPHGAELWEVGTPELPFDPGHMALVTDGRAAPVWERIATWIRTALTPP